MGAKTSGLGPHVLDLMVHFGGAIQWCTVTVTTKGKLVTPDDFIAGAEGIPMIAGDTLLPLVLLMVQLVFLCIRSRACSQIFGLPTRDEG